MSEDAVTGGSDGLGLDGTFDRRRALKFGGMAVSAAALAPTLLTLGASPASASGTPFFQVGSTTPSDSTYISQSMTITGSSGTVIATLAITGDNHTVSTSGSTAAFSLRSLVYDGSLTVATYKADVTSMSSVLFDASWSASAATAAVSFTHFPNSPGIYDFVSGTVANSTAVVVPAGLDVPVAADPAVIFCAGAVQTDVDTPGYTRPTGSSVVTQEWYSAAFDAIGVGVSQTVFHPVSATVDFGSRDGSFDGSTSNAGVMISLL